MASTISCLEFKWTKSVVSLEAEWKECFDDNHLMLSYNLQRVLEESNQPNVDLHYLTAYDERGILAVVPCFGYRFEMETVALPVLQRLVQGIRKVIPGFLRSRIFVIGSVMSTCNHLLGLKDMNDESRWNNGQLQAIFDELRKKAAELHIGLMTVKELPEEMTQFLKSHLNKQFFFFDSLPTTYFDVIPRERGGYVQAIRTRYRNKLKHRKAVAAAAGLHWEIVNSCKGLEKDLYALYSQVMDNTSVSFERMNEAYFFKVEEILRCPDSYYVLGYQDLPPAEGAPAGTPPPRKLISGEFVMCKNGTMYSLFVGFDYKIKASSDMYFNTYYEAIDEAERRNLAKIWFGQTCYEVKAEIGCKTSKLYIGVSHRNPILHRLLYLIRNQFMAKANFPDRDVFATPPPPKKNGQKKTDKGGEKPEKAGNKSVQDSESVRVG